jgi:hypothetical protein
VAVVWRPFVGSLAAAAAGFAVGYALPEHWFILLRVAALALTYLAVYGGLVVGMFGERASLRVAWSAAQSFLPSRLAPSVD